MDVEKLSKKINRRYWLFSIGFVVFGLGTALAIGMYNKALGVACLLAELTYFAYVNMINVGDMRIRLKAAQQYTKQLVIKQETDGSEKPEKSDHGQYL